MTAHPHQSLEPADEKEGNKFAGLNATPTLYVMYSTRFRIYSTLNRQNTTIGTPFTKILQYRPRAHVEMVCHSLTTPDHLSVKVNLQG